jgi:hypothetical protein
MPSSPELLELHIQHVLHSFASRGEARDSLIWRNKLFVGNEGAVEGGLTYKAFT